MFARLIIKIFWGSIWKLKRSCANANNRLCKTFLIKIYGWYQYENNSSIAWNSTFTAPPPCLPHGEKGIFVSGKSHIGRNCVIFQQVTIGSNKLSDSKKIGAPTIGENCYIGAGAKIIGKIKIGDNVRIGANTVVYKDVPSNSIVISGEQKIITKKQQLDNKFYSYCGRLVYFNDSKWLPVHDNELLAKLQGKD